MSHCGDASPEFDSLDPSALATDVRAQSCRLMDL